MNDRAAGALYGTLIGDALGRPFEGERELARIRAALDARLRGSLRPGTFGHSDDGEMMLLLARSLEECGRVVVEGHVLDTLARHHEVARGYGKGTRATMRAWLAGNDWPVATRTFWPEGSHGNGCVVRVAPIAILFAADQVACADAARASARATHAHPAAMEATAAAAELVRTHLLQETETETEADLDPDPDPDPNPDPDPDPDPEPPGPDAQSTLRAARHLLAQPSDDFATGLRAALELGGDTDSLGALVGAALGARFGRAAIPPEWITALEPPVHAPLQRFLEFAKNR